ncbi:MAG: sensor histidine kinase [Methyloceanibacter sp.]|uniref:sensor histidine kinase n=1 Tax=Methyloceanibacter sp. TaxID=1965321 RepID=UPI003D9B740B
MQIRLPKLLQSQSVLLGAGFAILVLIGTAGAFLSNQARLEANLIAHTLQVEKQISEVLLQLRRAESHERAYFITGQAEYLSDYQAAAKNVRPEFEKLRRLTADNVSQQRVLSELDPLLDRRLADFEEAVKAVQGQDLEKAQRIVRNIEGRDNMEQIRTLATNMAAEEQDLLTQRGAAAERTTTLLLAVTIGGAILIVLLGIAAVTAVQRSNRRRDEAEQGLIETNQNLEQIVSERTSDLQEANKEIQRFAYIVSHDLRSPLVNIMGFTAELEAWRDDALSRIQSLRDSGGGVAGDEEIQEDEGELAGEFTEAIQFIKSSITKMDRLINAVLKLSREGRREFHPETIKMSELLDGIISTVAHQTAETGTTITVRDLPQVNSDRLALEQVFSNLVDNALKYLKDGVPGEIEISAQETPLQIVFEVKDNGRGIDGKDHERIFDLFRRAGQQDRPGEGIGLAHVRTLVRRLGGRMDVKSELGEGSTFIVALPKYWRTRSERSAA